MAEHGASPTGGPAEPAGIDWAQAEAWDRAYYLHAVQAGSELAYVPVERVDGSYLVLADGTRLLDFQSQLISDSLGHRHPRVHAEIARAMERYGHVFFGLATDYRARAAKLLLEDVLGAPRSWAGRVRILASGTEAVEQALLMARLSTGRPIVLTQAHSYHGFTVGTTMLRGYRGNLTPGGAFDRVVDVPGFPAANVVTIPAPEFHDHDGPRPLPSLAATEEIIRAVGPENIAAVITETMLGASGLLPPDDYLPGLVEIARRHGILWIADEVLTGFGRLGEWFGYQCYPGLEPDLLVLGKGLNGCALPCGAVVASRAIAEPIEQARWWSGSTHDAHPLVCASIVGAIETLLEEDVLGRVRHLGSHLEAGLRALADRHPSVRRVSGKGLYHAVDLARPDGSPIVPEDRGTAFLGDLASQPNNVVARECAARGVFLGGFVPNTIKVAPPFTVDEAEIDLGLAAFDEALSVVDDLAARA
ncbi:MAG: aspartate aminotransferase family protein [Thermoleophilia bacterium]